MYLERSDGKLPLEAGKPFLCPAPVGNFTLTPHSERSIAFHREILWPLLLEDKDGLWLFTSWLNDETRLWGINMCTPWETLPWCWDLLPEDWKKALNDYFYFYHADSALRVLKEYSRLNQDALWLEQMAKKYGHVPSMPAGVQKRFRNLLDPTTREVYKHYIRVWEGANEQSRAEMNLSPPDAMIDVMPSAFGVRADDYFTRKVPEDLMVSGHIGAVDWLMPKLLEKWKRWCRTHNKGAGPAILDRKSVLDERMIGKWRNAKVVQNRVTGLPSIPEPSKPSARSSVKPRRQETG